MGVCQLQRPVYPESCYGDREYHIRALKNRTKPFTEHDVADDLLQFMKNRYNNAYTNTKQQPALGMFVGGYPQNEFFADAYTYEFPKKASLESGTTQKPRWKAEFWY